MSNIMFLARLSAERLAQFGLGHFQRPLSRRAQVLAGPVKIKGQHRHRRAERRTRLSLRSADRLSDSAMRVGSSLLKTPCSRSRALLFFVTSADHLPPFRLCFGMLRFSACPDATVCGDRVDQGTNSKAFGFRPLDLVIGAGSANRNLKGTNVGE
jgi:hypothetical protein